MKKVYFMAFIATAALTMTSCSNDDITTGGEVSKNEATAINFSTYLGRTAQTRGTVTETGTAFGVFASYTGKENFNTTSGTQNFMYNQQVTSSDNGSTWTYDPVKYWPTADGEKVSFFAYAPYSSNENNGNITFKAVREMTGTPQITVKVPSDLSKTTDFVAASVVNQDKTTDGKVSYTLLHEMTRLTLSAAVNKEVFKEKDAHNQTYVVVKSIKIKSGASIYASGTYTFSATNTVSSTSSDRVTGSWSSTTQSTSDLDFSSLLNKETTPKVTGIDGVYLTGTSTTSLLQNNQYAFLIPVKNGLTQDAAKVEIEYSIVTVDSKLANGYSCTNATKELSLPTGILEQGKAYNLAFTINVNEISLSATPEAWSEVSDNSTVTVPASN